MTDNSQDKIKKALEQSKKFANEFNEAFEPEKQKLDIEREKLNIENKKKWAEEAFQRKIAPLNQILWSNKRAEIYDVLEKAICSILPPESAFSPSEYVDFGIKKAYHDHGRRSGFFGSSAQDIDYPKERIRGYNLKIFPADMANFYSLDLEVSGVRNRDCLFIEVNEHVGGEVHPEQVKQVEDHIHQLLEKHGIKRDSFGSGISFRAKIKMPSIQTEAEFQNPELVSFDQVDEKIEKVVEAIGMAIYPFRVSDDKIEELRQAKQKHLEDKKEKAREATKLAKQRAFDRKFSTRIKRSLGFNPKMK